MGCGLLLSLQYPDICISTANCLECETDWSPPAGAEVPSVRRPVVRHSYSIMGPEANLGLLDEATCRNEHFYVIPNRVTERFNNLTKRLCLFFAESVHFEMHFTSVIHTNQHLY
jgi:hypothetical protein